MTLAPVVELDGVAKAFGATVALRDVGLRIRPGEFIGLVGPNGAGKSTLIKVLDGVYTPDRGVIRIGGRARAAFQGRLPGVGVVHQDLGVIGSLTVADNLRLGMPPLRLAGPFISHRKERDFCAATLESVGLSADLAPRPAETLTLGEQTLVAVARTLAGGARLLVMDEATSSLSPAESEWLLQSLRERTAAGAAVLMVTHKMSEIIESTDRCVVMVDGAIQADVATKDTDVAELAELMSPATNRPASHATATDTGDRPTKVVLRLAGAATAQGGPFDLTVRAGEIVGVTGIVGSGLYELAMLAGGFARCVDGRRELASGIRIGFLAPDRGRQANFPERSAAWNLTAGALERWRTKAGLLNLHREFRDAAQRHAELRVRPGDPLLPQAVLSGGNQQKVLLGRALLQARGALVLVEPTRGVDVQTRAEIYRFVREAASVGTGVLVVSSDAEDLIALADKVGVVTDGALSEPSPLADLDAKRLAELL